MAASDVSRDGTAQGLVEFFDYLADRGLMNKSTATARKTATTKVLSIDEGWEDTDLRALDLDEQFERFTRLQKQGYKPNSLAVYGSRFRSAVHEYLQYLDDPSSFKAGVSRPAPKKAVVDDGSGTSPPVRPKAHGTALPTDPAAPPAQQHKLVTYPFPLRGTGVMAYLQLPHDLRAEEASRLGRFVESLVVPDETAD